MMTRSYIFAWMEQYQHRWVVAQDHHTMIYFKTYRSCWFDHTRSSYYDDKIIKLLLWWQWNLPVWLVCRTEQELRAHHECPTACPLVKSFFGCLSFFAHNCSSVKSFLDVYHFVYSIVHWWDLRLMRLIFCTQLSFGEIFVDCSMLIIDFLHNAIVDCAQHCPRTRLLSYCCGLRVKNINIGFTFWHLGDELGMSTKHFHLRYLFDVMQPLWEVHPHMVLCHPVSQNKSSNKTRQLAVLWFWPLKHSVAINNQETSPAPCDCCIYACQTPPIHHSCLQMVCDDLVKVCDKFSNRKNLIQATPPPLIAKFRLNT